MGRTVSGVTGGDTNRKHIKNLKRKGVLGGGHSKCGRTVIEFLDGNLNMKKSVKGRQGLYSNKWRTVVRRELNWNWKRRGGLNT